MRKLHQIIRRRVKLRIRRRSSVKSDPLAQIAIALILLSAALLLMLSLAYADLTRSLPSLTAFERWINTPPQPSFFTDQSGRERLLTVRYRDFEDSALRRYPEIGGYAKDFIRALVSSEQSDFFNDDGALFSVPQPLNPQPQRISEKLAGIIFGDQLGTGLKRAIRLRILGSQIQRAYPREKILIAYLENVWFGQLSIGVSAAMRTYLDKSAADATLADGVLMSAILEKPTLNPIDSHGATRTLYLEKIDRLLSAGAITADEADSLRAYSFIIFEPPAPDQPQRPNPLLQKAFQSAVNAFGLEAIERGNIAVRTTIDAELQSYLACLSGIAPDQDAPETNGQSVEADVSEPEGRIEEESESGETAPSGCPLSEKIDPGDARTFKRIYRSADFSAIVLNVRTGAALAGVQAITTPNGIRISEKSFRSYPPGSVITPFAALTAYSNGYSPASSVWDIPSARPEFNPPDDRRGQSELGPIRLRTALTQDRLSPIVELTRDLGSDKIMRTMAEFGLSNWSGLNAGRLYFGGGFVSVENLAAAFSAFAGGGQISGAYADSKDPLPVPRTVLAAFRPDSAEPIELQPRASLRFLDEPLAYLVNHTFSADDQTYRFFERPTAVKIGRTLSDSSRWFIGYTPDRVIALRIGAVADTSGRVIEEAITALFRSIAEKAHKDLPISGWTQPESVATRLVCAESGKRLTAACPNPVSEVFLTGNEPLEADDRYRNLTVNSETGALATALTPFALRAEKTFLDLPDFAEYWAKTNQIEAVPTIYDAVREKEAGAVQIFAPVSFTDVGLNAVSGTKKVEIKVEFNAENPIRTVLVQYGRGLDPNGWYLIEERPAIENGRWTVAEFDYDGLESGIYAIRVAAIDADNRYERDDCFILIP